MKILVINAGSSSLKYQLIDMTDERVLAKGVCDRIGITGSFIEHTGSKKIKKEVPMPTHLEAVKLLLAALVDKEHGVINSMAEINAVGHRVVHSGEDFTSSAVIDDKVLKIIESNSDMAPIHMPPNITGIKACRDVIANAPMVAVFDTTFHSTMPEHAKLYAIPYDDYKKYKLRRYGFHGSSHKFITSEVAHILNKPQYKVVICHLGNGASISAVENGRCIDTSMGLTPLEGLIMGTRSGDIDPAALEFLMDRTGMDIHQMVNYLNKKSGVLGISGLSSDFRDLTMAAEQGNERALLAIDMFSYRVKKYIGSYVAALGGIDCLVFTGGIGEYSPIVRQKVTKGLEFFGLTLDQSRNANPERGNYEISVKDSKSKIYIIPTNEELLIARETMQLIKN